MRTETTSGKNVSARTSIPAKLISFLFFKSLERKSPNRFFESLFVRKLITIINLYNENLKKK